MYKNMFVFVWMKEKKEDSKANIFRLNYYGLVICIIVSNTQLLIRLNLMETAHCNVRFLCNDFNYYVTS